MGERRVSFIYRSYIFFGFGVDIGWVGSISGGRGLAYFFGFYSCLLLVFTDEGEVNF